MGKRQKYLEKLIYNTFKRSNENELLKLNDILDTEYSDMAFEMYKNLGGVHETLKFRLGRYDISCKDFIIELDEELHFNRYRKLTLQADVYKKLSTFPLDNYLQYCKTHEKECLRAGGFGGKWKNSSTEKYFATSSNNGKLSGIGSSRWKQRAFYDFLKDISQLILGVNIIRISIWDLIDIEDESFTVGYLLDKHQGDDVIKLIKKKLSYI